jgi:hypothetical protein
LREPIYFLWELRSGHGKDLCAQYRSAASVGIRRGSGTLIYDHAIPFRYLQEALLDLDPLTPEAVEAVLNRYGVAVLLTKGEDAQLAKCGLARSMPAGWEVGKGDPLARYKEAQIEVIPNPSCVDRSDSR